MHGKSLEREGERDREKDTETMRGMLNSMGTDREDLKGKKQELECG